MTESKSNRACYRDSVISRAVEITWTRRVEITHGLGSDKQSGIRYSLFKLMNRECVATVGSREETVRRGRPGRQVLEKENGVPDTPKTSRARFARQV